MGQGMAPAAACQEAVARIVGKNPAWRDIQVGYLALNRAGQAGAYAIAPHCQVAVRGAQRDELLDVANHLAQNQ